MHHPPSIGDLSPCVGLDLVALFGLDGNLSEGQLVTITTLLHALSAPHTLSLIISIVASVSLTPSSQSWCRFPVYVVLPYPLFYVLHRSLLLSVKPLHLVTTLDSLLEQYLVIVAFSVRTFQGLLSLPYGLIRTIGQEFPTTYVRLVAVVLAPSLLVNHHRYGQIISVHSSLHQRKIQSIATSSYFYVDIVWIPGRTSHTRRYFFSLVCWNVPYGNQRNRLIVVVFARAWTLAIHRLLALIRDTAPKTVRVPFSQIREDELQAILCL